MAGADGLQFVDSKDMEIGDIEPEAPQRPQVTLSNAICHSAHPVTAFAHVAFKVAALTVYILCETLGVGFIMSFVSLILLLAFDFWTVKNVSGRLMVGLRWWNNVREDGTNEWVFESHNGAREIESLDWRIFWGGLFGAFVGWGFMFVISLLKFNFQWTVVCIVALTLTGANVVGYLKCNSDAQKNVKNFITKNVGQAVVANMLQGGPQ